LIPYLQIPPLKLGPIPIHPFGILIAVGIWVGVWVTVRRAREKGIDESIAYSALGWVLVGAFLGGHLFEVLAYYPEKLRTQPWILLMVWKGLSSIGGFAGALIGLGLFCRRRRQPFARLVDLIVLGLLPGWIFGRIGCALAHDHPGARSDFVLAVAFPGGARHDLGFYELLLTIGLFLVFEVVRRRTTTPGRIALLAALLYAPARFALDTLRVGDRRYAAFTPAQVCCAALIVVCLVLLARQELSKRRVAAAPRVAVASVAIDL
jgi:phosphatidylglycerol:prolipoprotein diacylglycerol transferase